ncbi:MAG: hypothetical protein OCC45_06995 [Desulfotalea sp.]
MSSCKNCGTTFKALDVLKTFNPANIKCSGCSERIKSSYVPLVISVVILLLLICIYLIVFLGTHILPKSILTFFMGPIVIGIGFEFAYFYLLSSGKIKSDLNLDSTKIEQEK